jgi:ubiquinone/menaquinone biosynthesis C-methylase UbiE
MGLYSRFILPRLLDKMASGPAADQYRKQVLSEARGRVLEIGFGTGLNAAHYPKSVEKVIGIDPSDGGSQLRQQRAGGAPVPIEFRVASGERLPFDDGSFDTVVTTLSLCSIPDVDRALAEVRRVLAPGGRYLFLEHGLHPDATVQRWQHRINGLNKLLLGGCNLNRNIKQLIERAGFVFTHLEQFEFPEAPRFASFTNLGSATPALS